MLRIWHANTARLCCRCYLLIGEKRRALAILRASSSQSSDSGCASLRARKTFRSGEASFALWDGGAFSSSVVGARCLPFFSYLNMGVLHGQLHDILRGKRISRKHVAPVSKSYRPRRCFQRCVSQPVLRLAFTEARSKKSARKSEGGERWALLISRGLRKSLRGATF